jgi:hypothetical protein
MVSHIVVYTTVLRHNKSVDSVGYKNKHIYKADENGLFFRLPPNKTLSLKAASCNGGENSKGMITVLLACSVDGTNQLPPLVTAAHKISRQQN